MNKKDKTTSDKMVKFTRTSETNERMKYLFQYEDVSDNLDSRDNLYFFPGVIKKEHKAPATIPRQGVSTWNNTSDIEKIISLQKDEPHQYRVEALCLREDYSIYKKNTLVCTLKQDYPQASCLFMSEKESKRVPGYHRCMNHDKGGLV